MRFYMNVDVLGSTDLVVSDIHTHTITGGGVGALLTVSTGGVLSMALAGGTPVTGPTISTDTWYRIDIWFDVNDRSVSWEVDGTDETAPTAGSNFTLSDVDHWDFGSVSGGTNSIVFIDDAAISMTDTDYPIGAGSVRAMIVDGAGTHNGASVFRNEDNTNIDSSSPGRLDELPLGSGFDSVKQITVNSGDYLEFTLADPIAYEPQGVKGWVDVRRGQVGDTGTSLIRRQDGTDTNIQAGFLPTDSEFWAIIPPPSGGWTQSELQALVARLGYSTDVTPSWHGIMVEAAFSATAV